jgi:DNA topoisomerase-2
MEQTNISTTKDGDKKNALTIKVTKPVANIKIVNEKEPMQVAENKQVNYPTAESYKRYDQIEHVYKKTDMYIGSDEKVLREEWLYNIETKQMLTGNIDFTPGCERIYMEILTNASDNVGRSRREGVNPGQIDIVMNNSTISITNHGLPIPVVLTEEGDMYVPQMIFGTLLTSSNYDKDRHEAGTNGIGAKATNIFSTEFMIIIHDHIRKSKYTQVWNNNMRVCGPHDIQPYNGTSSSVQIVYKMDFARFGYPVPNGNEGGYPGEAFALFARHAVDISFTAKTTVTFNGHIFNFENIRDYARLYFGENVDSAIVHYQWPAGTEVVKKKKGYQVAKNPAITPEVELIAIDTPDEGAHVSFVNCIMTREGGVHVNNAIKAVGEKAVQMINENVLKKLNKLNKGKELDSKEKRSHTVNINDVKPHISILLAVKVLNPKFASQTKTMLQSPTPKIDIAEEELKAITKWQLIDRLYAALEAKQFNNLAKTDGKLSKYVKTLKGVNANQAGKSERHKCILYVAEGRSGAGYVNKLIGLLPGRRDYAGVLPMRGKSLNVMNADALKYNNNTEIRELKKMLGLVDCPDNQLKNTYYLDPTNFAKLRYGGVMIMADSDLDGKHIIGLILNFFHCRFPSLLARGYIMYYRTPILRVYHGRQSKRFYTQREYDEWQKATATTYSQWKHKYFKGLGSSTDADIKEDFQERRQVNCYYDDKAPEAMRLAFDKRLTRQRKDWLAGWIQVMGVDELEMQPVSTFINHELILFSIANVQRSIPKLMDGFKESHRKIIHGAHLKFGVGSLTKEYNELKVAQFGGFIAEKVNYHHGELILDDVIVGMAQDFTGSNNIPWFTQGGQFGSRYEGGKDASETRYTHTKPEKLVPYILRKEDQPILVSVIDEGEHVEPETYYPIIPMILVNGAQGIATGYSTFIPNHNPLDVINWLKLKIQGVEHDKLPEIIPWYRGFTGDIQLIDRSKRPKRNKVKVTIINNEGAVPKVQTIETDDNFDLTGEALNAEEENIESDEEDRQLLTMVTHGKFNRDNKGNVTITELPIGRWPGPYNKWLEDLIEAKLINKLNNQSLDNTVFFEIGGVKLDHITYKSLKLQRSYGMSNMVVLGSDNKPTRYDTSYDIIESFYEQRLVIYKKRKEFGINQLAIEIHELNEKIRFIRAVKDKDLLIIDRPKSEIYQTMDRLGLSHDFLDKDKVKLRNCTQDEINKLADKIISREQERSNLMSISHEKIWLSELEELEAAYRRLYCTQKQITSLSIAKPSNALPRNAIRNKQTKK